MLNKISTQDSFNTIRSIRCSNHIHGLPIQTQHRPVCAEFVSRMRSYDNTNSARLRTETGTPVCEALAGYIYSEETINIALVSVDNFIKNDFIRH